MVWLEVTEGRMNGDGAVGCSQGSANVGSREEKSGGEVVNGAASMIKEKY
jgi:hypothetical protein